MSIKNATPRPTIRDVARLANVSVGTVSAVINNSGRPVAAATHERVLKCIYELQFEPNNAARNLKKRIISSIGFVVPDLNNSFFTEVAEGIQAALSEVDCMLVLCLTHSEESKEEYYAHILHTQRLDGVIYLSGTGLPCAALLSLAKNGVVIFVDEMLPGFGLPFINSTNRIGARELGRYVLQVGHRRLAILTGPRGLWSTEQRHAGFREACIENQLDPDSQMLIQGDYSEQSGRDAADYIATLPTETRPSVILCCNDLMAIGFILRARECGLSVPADISVTGFDDIAQSRLMTPALTTVRQPAREMGLAAAGLLLHKIGRLDKAPDQIEFDTLLCIRDSVSPVK